MQFYCKTITMGGLSSKKSQSKTIKATNIPHHLIVDPNILANVLSESEKKLQQAQRIKYMQLYLFKTINQQFGTEQPIPQLFEIEPKHKIYYPINKQQTYERYNKAPNITDKKYNLSQSLKLFGDKLKNMVNMGYDFKEINWKFKPAAKNQKIYWSQTKINIYTKIKCLNKDCKTNNIKSQQLLQGIHINGKIQLNYLISNLQQFLDKYPKYQQTLKINQKQLKQLKYEQCIQWEIKFHDLSCRGCGKWCENIQIYQDQIQPAIQSFCYEIAAMVDKNYAQKQNFKQILLLTQKQKQMQQLQQQKQQKNQNNKQFSNNPYYIQQKKNYQSQSQSKSQEYSQKKDKSQQQQSQSNSNSQSQQQYEQQQQSNYSYQEQQYQQQIISKYPYHRQQINALFRDKNVTDQAVYNLYQAQQYVLQELQMMEQYGFDFRIQPRWNFSSKSKSNRIKYNKKMKRKLYVRIKCKNCIDQNGRQKAWTSILGVGQVNFFIDTLAKFLNDNPQFQSSNKSPEEEAQNKEYPLCIRWNLQIYRMKCKDCNEWGETFIYEKQLQALAKSFCFIISQIAEDIQNPFKKHKDTRYKLRQVHKHEQHLCEACQKGQCFNISKLRQGKESEI